MQLAEQYVGLFNLSDYVNAGLESKTDSASALIGPEGGMVTVTDPDSPVYGASLRVPAGALETPVRITIGEGEHTCAFGLGPSLELLPCGLNFKRAATLTVYLNGTTGAQEGDLERSVPVFYHYDESSDQWTHNVAARLKRLGDAVLCELNHL